MTIASDDVGRRNRTTVFLSLLPPLKADRQLAVVMVAASVAIFVALAPFAKAPLTTVLGFIPIYQSALFMSDAMSGNSENATQLRGDIAADARLLSRPFRKIDLAERLRGTLDKR